MGGATENDEAMKWFLKRSDGGDVLVLRASGSDGYNDYMFDSLGLPLNSVETIRFDSATAASEPYIQRRIREAEAIWLAGGNQWDYVDYWRDTPIDSLINEGIKQRNMVIGGTSAGMAVLGSYYFTAENGTVYSDTVLNDPYHPRVSVDKKAFLDVPFMDSVITDTHYDNPDRNGRHVTFMARIFKDWDVPARGIACDEFTAVCIDTNGTASVYGNYPQYNDNVYFIQPNCELDTMSPENCTPGTPLNWQRKQQALKVYKVKGTSDGSNTFDVSNWKSGNGGTWQHWYVAQGKLKIDSGTAINCNQTTGRKAPSVQTNLKLFPNPVQNGHAVKIIAKDEKLKNLQLFNLHGRVIHNISLSDQHKVSIKDLEKGIYLLRIQTRKKTRTRKLMIK
jgi:cyanophycinase-like exopeptidase